MSVHGRSHLPAHSATHIAGSACNDGGVLGGLGVMGAACVRSIRFLTQFGNANTQYGSGQGSEAQCLVAIRPGERVCPADSDFRCASR